eukprot:gene3305-723_t
MGYGAELTDQEVTDLVSGKLPDGSTVPIYSFDVFKAKTDLPQRYSN